MTKEYLNMAYMFRGGERHSDMAGIGGVIDANGEFILQTIENRYSSTMLQGDRNEYRDTIAKYAAHAISSHDELVAEVERLRGAINDAFIDGCRVGWDMTSEGYNAEYGGPDDGRLHEEFSAIFTERYADN